VGVAFGAGAVLTAFAFAALIFTPDEISSLTDVIGDVRVALAIEEVCEAARVVGS
jgi:hypothetical protein